VIKLTATYGAFLNLLIYVVLCLSLHCFAIAIYIMLEFGLTPLLKNSYKGRFLKDIFVKLKL